MTALEIAVNLIKQFEGCKLNAYLDIVNVPTIGYGETKGVKLGMVWTQEQADSTLKVRVKEFMDGVVKACPKLSFAPANQLAACTSLAYNIGLSAFANSTVCKKLTKGDAAGAADAIMMWNMAGGKVVNGLTNRRQAERKVFLSPAM